MVAMTISHTLYNLIYLINFNYPDLNIQIGGKPTIRMSKNLKKIYVYTYIQDLNNQVSLYRIRRFLIKINCLSVTQNV